MNFSTYNDLAAQMAVDLVNTLDPVAGDDSLQSLGDLREFLSQYQKDWPAEDWRPGRPNKADLAAVLELREVLRGVFSAESADEAARILHGILADASASPRISVQKDRPHFRFETQAAGTAAWLAVTTASGLSVVLCDVGLDRFGSCSSHTCVDVYVDSSKNRSRRHCSTRCATRENVAALRQRQRTAEQTPHA